MGHSMGGGAAMLASQYNPAITVVSGLTPANTNPSAITAAAGVAKPVLLFAGSNDCVTPASANGLAMYNNLNAGSCKTFVTITGGNHCYFGNYNFNCSFGESTCSPSATISRSTQQSRTMTLLRPWLDFYLKGNAAALSTFTNALNNTTGIIFQRVCLNGFREDAEVAEPVEHIKAFPNPATESVTVLFNAESDASFLCTVTDLSGKAVLQTQVEAVAGTNQVNLDCATWQRGVYLVYITGNDGTRYAKVVKQ
jgi:hypothetical protein